MPLADHAEASRALMREMNLSEADIERRQKMVGLGPDDLRRIAAIKDLVVGRIEQYASSFFGHLATLEEGRTLLSNPELITRARALKLGHLAAMVGGEYGPPYVEQRLGLASLYAGAGLDTRAFLGAFHHLLKAIGTDVIKKFERTPLEGFEHFMSFNKVAFFDIGVIIDVLVFERERVIRQQQEAIRELSTPVLKIRDQLLLLPIIGAIDSARASLVTENLLSAIRAHRAKVVVMDITGVASVDSRVANHLLQTVAATRLMGAQVIVTGVTSDVSVSLIALGIELSKLNAVGDLQGGLERANQILADRVARAVS
jgi:rsbT co-antagonist protein RsbR